MEALAWLGDICLLSLLYIACCIPVVTVGAATTALYYDALKLAENRERYIARDFLRAFRRNFRQATVIWLLILGGCAVLAADLLVAAGMGRSAPQAAIVIGVGCVGVVLALMALYVFPVLARFDNTVKNTMRNALFMAVRHFPSSIVIMALHILPLLLAAASPAGFVRVVLPALLLAGAVLPYLEAKMFSRIFRLYYPKTDAQEADFAEADSARTDSPGTEPGEERNQ